MSHHRRRRFNTFRLAMERWTRDRKRPALHRAEERAVLTLLKRMPKHKHGRLAISASGIARTTGMPSADVKRALSVLISRRQAQSYTYNGRHVYVLGRAEPTGIYRVPSGR